MAVAYVTNALGATNSSTSFSITLPTTAAGDLLILEYANRGTDTGTIGGTSVSTGGLTWTNKHSQLFATDTFSGHTFYTIATGDHGGQTVTGTGMTNSCAAIVTVYSGADPAAPLDAATVVGEANASGNETQAQITTTVGGAYVVLVVVNAPDVAVSTQACTTPGALTERAERLSTGGLDTAVAHASAEMSAPGATGAFTWAQTNGAGGSWAYAIKPAPVTTAPTVGTYRVVGQTPSVEWTNLGQNAWATGAWASGAWATGAWDVAAAGGETASPTVGTYRFVGQAPTVGYTHSVAPTLGTFRFVGQTPSVGYTHSVLPTVGTYRFVGQAPSVSYADSTTVTPSVGTYRFVGLAPTVGYTDHMAVAPAVGTFRFVGLAPTVGFTHSASPSVGAVQFAGQVPVAGFTHSVAPTAGALRFDGQAPSIPADGYAWAIGAWASGAWAAGAWAPGSLDATASPTVGTVRLVGQTPTVGYTQSVAPTVGTVRFDGQTPSVGFTHSVAPSAGTFRFDGLQPTVTWGDNMAVAPSVGSLVFVGQQPTVLNLSGYAWHPNAWASGAWAYGAWAPDSAQAVASPSTGVVRLVGQQPTLETGAKVVAPSAGVLRFVGQQPPLGDTSALVGFDAPAQSLVEGADLQTFRVLVRKTTGTNPTVDIALYEAGAWVADLVTGTAVTSEVGQIVEATWDAALLADVTGADVQCFVYGNSSADAQVEIGAVEWLAAITAVASPSVGTIRIVGQTPTTGAAYTVAPSVGTVRFGGQQPSLTATDHVWITPSVGAVRFGGYAPVLSATAHQWVVPSVGTLRFAGQQPTLIEGGDKTTAPESGVLRFVGNAPSIPENEVVRPSGGWLAFNDSERARHKRKEQEEAEREIEALERHLVAEKILTTPSENLNAARLRLLAEQYRGSDLLDNRAQRALAYAERAKTELSYQLALRELQRQAEDEEMALLMLLAAD